jgi:hypothetical protein
MTLTRTEKTVDTEQSIYVCYRHFIGVYRRPSAAKLDLERESFQ